MFVKRKKRLFVLLKDAVSSGRFEIVKDNYRFVADIETEVDREDRKPRMSIDFNNGTAEIRLVNVSDPRGLGRKVADALYRYFRGDMGIIDLLKKVYEAYEDEAHRQDGVSGGSTLVCRPILMTTATESLWTST